ncbi:MAG: GvpL/GvpF family gas vesicle protein [Elusimicrobia bacterium]|nr:GvpL/GvpF family gas vesicle protein [Elusimicrobiota bacterium]
MNQSHPPQEGTHPLHLYGVVRGDPDPLSALTGLDAGQVFAVRHGVLSVFAGACRSRDYRSMKKEEVVPHLMAHQTVLEKILERHTVLPVKFPTVVRNQEEVLSLLEAGEGALSQALEAMESKVELNLVAVWRNLATVFQKISQEADIQQEKAGLAALAEADRPEALRRIGRNVKTHLENFWKEQTKEILEPFKSLALAFEEHAVLDDSMIFNRAFLVERSQLSAFEETLLRADGDYNNQINFRLVGPLPPYSFALVEVQGFQYEDVDAARRLLGLGESADPEEIKQAYRRLAGQYHPDRASAGDVGGDGFFPRLTEARDLLDRYCRDGRKGFGPSEVGKTVLVSVDHQERQVQNA